MLKKKWLALLLMLMMAMGVLTGCSPTEMSYYNLMKEASTQKVYTDVGSMEISMAKLPASLFAGEEAANQEMVRKAIDKLRIEYTGKVDVNQDVFQYDFKIIDGSAVEKGSFSLLYKDDVLYLKLDELINYLGEFYSPAERQNFDQIFADVQWVSISDKDLSNMMPEVSQAGITSNLLQKSAQQQLIYRRLLDALFNDVYNNHTSNLVSQSNNKYTLTLRGAQLIDVAKPAAIYTINNIDKLSTTLKTFLNSLTPAEITDLGLTNEIKGQALQGLDLMVLAVNQDRSKYLQEIENMSATSKDELLKTINDSELVASIEKADSKTYNTASKLHVDVTVDNPADRIEFTLNTKDTMISGGTVQVAAPTTGLITLTELQQRLPRELTVNVDSGFYTQSNGLFSDSGKMNVQMVNSRTYLPLRLTGESLGEEVGWDQASHQAYVMQNGQRINMNGIIVNSRTYIKIRDFEQLGFKVGWNDAVRTVTIEK